MKTGILFLVLHFLGAIGFINGKLFGQEFYDDTLNVRLSLNDFDKSSLLLPFNVTRTPGSPGSQKTQKFIESHFNQLRNDWLFEEDKFSQSDFNFTNLVFTLGQNASSYLILSAHYDSKLVPEGFVGAIDSAASCGILLYIAEFVDSLFDGRQDITQKEFHQEPMGLKIVFFDGEEALKEWTSEDSIYGSKHLAEKWSKDGTMSKIDLFILLDLLGSVDNVRVPSYFSSSAEEYKHLIEIESLNQHNLPYRETLFDSEDPRFQNYNGIVIEDDHLPFLKNGVRIMHLIPLPFPTAWHTLEDNFNNLDKTKIQNWSILLCELVYSRLADQFDYF
ncbi:LADA_0H16468g1_1 [Lachancea dasiensis]|uniref:Peptide hydrolase n=1 Tax=Lachancea dasiensis TaxID=1072105 RepID=A0A1G4K596_9SACH|nr:LADA_0H16468g1_1 [Lachancea dasiensis]